MVKKTLRGPRGEWPKVAIIPEALILMRAEARRRRCRIGKVIDSLLDHLPSQNEKEKIRAARERIQRHPVLSRLDLEDEGKTISSQVLNDLILTYLPRA